MFKNAFISLILLSAVALADEDNTGQSPREKNKTLVQKIYRNNLRKYEGDADMLVLPGLLADRIRKQVLLQAEATGLKGGEIAEFFLIAENSGHDYESLAVSFAGPGDVHKALIFIGMQAGRPVNGDKLQFQPKGERVLMTFARHDTKDRAGPVRVEKMILDKQNNKSMRETGLVFTGSIMIDSVENPGTKVYAADIYGPKSIASNYNERKSVLDVPRQAPQSAVYNSQLVDPDFALPANCLLQVVIEPEYKDGKKRVMDIFLDMNVKLDNMVFHMLGETFELNGVLEKFTSLLEKGHDPFVTLRFDDKLTLKTVREFCAVLSAMETEEGIRVEPPLAGHLYYKAFLPDEEFRNRAGRTAQPWELRLSVKAAGIAGILTQIEQVWTDDKIQPDLKITDYEVAGPKELRDKLDKIGPGLPVIIVYAPPAVTHGQLIRFLAPVLPTHGTIHVFSTAAR